MARRIVSFVLVSCFAGLLAVSPAGAADARLHAILTGAAERPGPGDPDGIGRAVITINDATNQVCLILQFVNVTLPTTGLHIHAGSTEVAGPIRVRFSNPTSNQHIECVTVNDEAVLDDIAANPANYYINLHTEPGFAPGAIRGQLHRL